MSARIKNPVILARRVTDIRSGVPSPDDCLFKLRQTRIQTSESCSATGTLWLMACFCGDRREIKFFKMTNNSQRRWQRHISNFVNKQHQHSMTFSTTRSTRRTATQQQQQQQCLYLMYHVYLLLLPILFILQDYLQTMGGHHHLTL